MCDGIRNCPDSSDEYAENCDGHYGQHYGNAFNVLYVCHLIESQFMDAKSWSYAAIYCDEKNHFTILYVWNGGDNWEKDSGKDVNGGRRIHKIHKLNFISCWLHVTAPYQCN